MIYVIIFVKRIVIAIINSADKYVCSTNEYISSLSLDHTTHKI